MKEIKAGPTTSSGPAETRMCILAFKVLILRGGWEYFFFLSRTPCDFVGLSSLGSEPCVWSFFGGSIILKSGFSEKQDFGCNLGILWGVEILISAGQSKKKNANEETLQLPYLTWGKMKR